MILAVVEKPDPPWGWTWVVAGSRERALEMAESSFIADVKKLRTNRRPAWEVHIFGIGLAGRELLTE